MDIKNPSHCLHLPVCARGADRVNHCAQACAKGVDVAAAWREGAVMDGHQDCAATQ
jgi:hypothetical protein